MIDGRFSGSLESDEMVGWDHPILFLLSSFKTNMASCLLAMTVLN